MRGMGFREKKMEIMRDCEELRASNRCHIPWSGIKLKVRDPQLRENDSNKRETISTTLLNKTYDDIL